MKKLLIATHLLLFICYSTYGESTNSNNDTISIKYYEISSIVPIDLFETIKTFILKKGDRDDYSTMYSNNPHYSFSGFESYLNPEIGQGNINCDTSISDFNELVIRDQNSNPQYYDIHIVRKGDLEVPLIHTWEGMSEEKVYLVYDDSDSESDDFELIKENLLKYMDTIRLEMSTLAFSMKNKPNYSKFICSNLVKDNFVSIQFETKNEFLIEIIDINGVVLCRQFHRDNSKNNILKVSIAQLSKGLYVCKLSASGMVLIDKIIKE